MDTQRAALIAASALAALALSAGQNQAPRYRNSQAPVEDRVRDLVGRMTLDEKFWQLFMIPGDLNTPANDYSHGVFGLQTPGVVARTQAERINAI